MDHGDPIISGVDSKVVPDKPDSYTGPRCGYTVREKKGDVTTTKKCGTPDVVWDVTGYGHHGQRRQTPVCGDHIGKAWKEWDVESATPAKK